MKTEYIANGVRLSDAAEQFSLPDTLDCGQAFRWRQREDGAFCGMAGARQLTLASDGEDILLSGCTREEFESFWFDYFDLGRDYAAIRRELSADETLARAVRYAPGIRVLNQEPWETTMTFILSANNNVKRIKGLVERLCEYWGERTPGGYAFPTAERLAGLTLGELAPLRAGYRDGYILDCARRVASGEIDLGAVASMPLEDARRTLMTIKGVGPKVADCALLFGFGRCECFPRDVWIKRAMAQLFPDGLPECAAPYAGIAQQYIFHYVRTGGGLVSV